jgi:starch synthase (maltosyl-transferring)
MTGRPVRVLLVESGRAFGGTERVVDALARRLDRERFDPWVVLETAPGLDEWADDLRRMSIPVDRRAEVESRFQWLRALGWYRFLKQNRDGVLHVHHVWPSADRYLVPLAHLAGMSAVVVTDHLSAPPHSRWQRMLKRWEMTRADVNVAVSEAVADTMSGFYDLPRDQYEVVPNGVNSPAELTPQEREAQRTAWDVPADAPLWLFVGRLVEQKGVDILLAAWAAIPSPRPYLVIVGDGPDRKSLEERAAALSLTDTVRFVGAVEDAGSCYRTADALVMPSRFEGMPLVLLEAMSAGLPVVTTSVGGIAEATRQGEMAVLVPSGDPQKLMQAVCNLGEAPEWAAELGRRAAKWAAEAFGEDHMVETYESLYRRALRLTQAATEARSPGSEAA